MNPVLVAVVILCACLLPWLVSGAVGTRLALLRDEREFALDGAQDFDDEPCCCHPSYARDACPLGFDDPDLRYFVTRPAIGWHEHEITKHEYIRLEHEFGWRQPGDTPGEPVTHWFCHRFTASAWTTRDGDRGDAPTHFGHVSTASWIDPSRTVHLDDRKPWSDPNREIEQVDDRGTRETQPAATDEEYFSRPLDIWPTARGDFGQARTPRQREGS